MANNPLLFNAAIAGASGAGQNQRWILNNNPASYSEFRDSVLVFATTVDSKIPTDPFISISSAQMLQSICAGVLANRYLPRDVTTGNMNSLAEAVAALYTALLPQMLSGLTTDNIENVSNVTGVTASDALDTLLNRRVNYLDQVDSGLVGLWNFNDTINAVVGPNFAVTTGTETAFSDIVPGVRCLEIGTPGRFSTAITAALQLTGDLSIEAIVFYDSSPTNHIMLSMGGSGGTAASNKLYEVFFPTPNYPRRWQFNWENGTAVAQNFQTPSVALSPSLPPIHNIVSIGWRRQSNVLTPWLSGRKFSVDSGVLAAPAGGSSAFLTLGGDALADNNTSFLIASLAIYNRARTDEEWKQSYNRSLGDFWGPIA